jgi:hypothetical protein
LGCFHSKLGKLELVVVAIVATEDHKISGLESNRYYLDENTGRICVSDTMIFDQIAFSIKMLMAVVTPSPFPSETV